MSQRVPLRPERESGNAPDSHSGYDALQRGFHAGASVAASGVTEHSQQHQRNYSRIDFNRTTPKILPVLYLPIHGSHQPNQRPPWQRPCRMKSMHQTAIKLRLFNLPSRSDPSVGRKNNWHIVITKCCCAEPSPLIEPNISPSRPDVRVICLRGRKIGQRRKN